MRSGYIEITLKEIEKQLEIVSRAMIQGEPVALEQSVAVFKELAVKFSEVLKSDALMQSGNSDLKSRIAALKKGLGDQRINLIRRSSAVDGALNSLMPSANPSTYASQSGRYGTSGRQTGAFKVLAA